MKSLQAELAHIVDVVNRLSLAHPEVAFTLISDGRQLTQTSGTGDLRQAIAGIYGLNTTKKCWLSLMLIWILKFPAMLACQS